MTASLIGSNTFGFADGSGGHVCNLGSSPTTGQLDVLCVNSNTVVTTPSGFTAAPTSVGGQGAYVYRRIAAGGESASVTITTSGDHNTVVHWSRWGNITAADDAKQTSVDSSSGASSPAHSTNALSATNELVIAFSANHSFPGPVPTTPVWGASFTGLTAASQGTTSTGVASWVGYILNGGTSAVSPSVSWTNNASDRYMLTLTFTTTAGASTINGTAAAALGALTGTATGVPKVLGTAASALGLLSGSATGVPTVRGVASSSLGALAAAATGTPTVLGSAAGSLGRLDGQAITVVAVGALPRLTSRSYPALLVSRSEGRRT